MKKGTCLVTGSVIAVQMVLAQAAFAQSNQSSASSGGGIEEIIVTANRRAENLQSVPIAVSAITAAAAEQRGITNTATLVQAAPALQVSRNGNAATIFLRGVGFSGGNVNDEPSVAMYVDGIYMPAANANFFSFNNIERIEVLKGPQGTLFGRNATAGVIQIITKNPTFEPTLSANIGYANYETISGDVYASTGLSDKVAVDVAAQGSHQGNGWGKNLTTGSDTYKFKDYSLRGKLLFQPTEQLQFLLSGNYNYNRGPAVSGQPPKGAANPLGQPYPGRYNVWSDTEDYNLVKSGGGSLRIDYDAGPVKLVSISAYQKVNGFFLLDQDTSSAGLAPFSIRAQIGQKNRMFSQEFQVTNGDDSVLTWLLGAYYYNYKAAYNPLGLRGGAVGGPPGVDINSGQKSESFAVFGQATYPITESTNITAGLRYTTEDQSHFDFWTAGDSNFVIIPEDRRKQSFEKVTWRLSIDQKLAPDVLVYASYNRGFKSGGFSLVVPPGAFPPYKPEVLDAYEAGLKSTLFDRKVRFNLAAFYYDYQNIQFQQTLPGVAYILNGPKAKLYGGEAELQIAVNSQFNLYATGSYTHSRYGNFPDAPRFDRLPNGNNVQVNGFNAKGNRLVFAPEWTFNIGGDYTIPTSSGDFTLAANGYYNDGSFSTPDNRLRIDSYWQLNASLSWTSPNKRFGASIWGRNLLNEYYYQLAIEQGAPYGDIVTPDAPRTYGIRLSFKY